MSQIIINLKDDPSWWFTGVFFIVISIVFHRFIFIWLPLLNKKFKLAKRKSELVTIKNHRQHDIKVHWLITRYWALVAVTMGFLSVTITTYLLSPNISGGIKNITIPVLLIMLVDVLLLAVLREKGIVKETIEESIKFKRKKIA